MDSVGSVEKSSKVLVDSTVCVAVSESIKGMAIVDWAGDMDRSPSIGSCSVECGTVVYSKCSVGGFSLRSVTEVECVSLRTE